MVTITLIASAVVNGSIEPAGSTHEVDGPTAARLLREGVARLNSPAVETTTLPAGETADAAPQHHEGA